MQVHQLPAMIISSTLDTHFTLPNVDEILGKPLDRKFGDAKVLNESLISKNYLYP